MMPLQCRFNTLSDELTDDEHNMYIYAARIWLMQDKMGIDFEMASMANWPFRFDVADCMTEFRYDTQNLGEKEFKALEERLWDEFKENEEVIKEWSMENLKRFQSEPEGRYYYRIFDGPIPTIVRKKNKSQPWYPGRMLTEEEFRMVRYATRSWLLQERVPLSFVQARIYLHEEKPETLEEIAEKFDLPLDKVTEAEAFIRRKVEDAEEKRDVFFGHTPIYPTDEVPEGHNTWGSIKSS